MRRGLAFAVAVAVAMPPGALAGPNLPQRDLIVELREVQASAAAQTGWDVSSADAARQRVAQQVRVRNGESARLVLGVTRPVQTWQAVPGVWGALAMPATQWISAGQALDVRPRWAGGARPVELTLRVQSQAFDPSVASGSAEPPQRAEAVTETTITLPPGEWVTLATTGAPEASANVVSSRDAAPARRALQVRVSAAPR